SGQQRGQLVHLHAAGERRVGELVDLRLVLLLRVGGLRAGVLRGGDVGVGLVELALLGGQVFLGLEQVFVELFGLCREVAVLGEGVGAGGRSLEDGDGGGGGRGLGH